MIATTLCLAILASAQPVGLDIGFAWTPGAGYPPGVTYELEANGVTATGISETEKYLRLPIRRGDVVDARVRALPPTGSADYKASEWATLRATLPADQSDPCVMAVTP